MLKINLWINRYMHLANMRRYFIVIQKVNQSNLCKNYETNNLFVNIKYWKKGKLNWKLQFVEKEEKNPYCLINW